MSGTRWLIHSLIFFPFVFRFLWGLIVLTTSLWAPECQVTWPMLDKNNSTTAFVFDMTGIMVLLGAGVAFIRGFIKRSDQLPGLEQCVRMGDIRFGRSGDVTNIVEHSQVA